MPEVIPVLVDPSGGDDTPMDRPAEVAQAETAPRAVLVEQNGPVRTQSLPPRHTAVRNAVIAAAAANVADQNPKRVRAVLMLASATPGLCFRVMLERSQLALGSMRWPANVPLEIYGTHEISVALDVADATTAELGILLDFWTE